MIFNMFYQKSSYSVVSFHLEPVSPSCLLTYNKALQGVLEEDSVNQSSSLVVRIVWIRNVRSPFKLTLVKSALLMVISKSWWATVYNRTMTKEVSHTLSGCAFWIGWDNTVSVLSSLLLLFTSSSFRAPTWHNASCMSVRETDQFHGVLSVRFPRRVCSIWLEDILTITKGKSFH